MAEGDGVAAVVILVDFCGVVVGVGLPPFGTARGFACTAGAGPGFDVGFKVDAAEVGLVAWETRGAAGTRGGGADLVVGTGFFTSGLACKQQMDCGLFR